VNGPDYEDQQAFEETGRRTKVYMISYAIFRVLIPCFETRHPLCMSKDPAAQFVSRQDRCQSPRRDSEAELWVVSNEMRLRSCSLLELNENRASLRTT